ncbi:Acetyltransferase (GNAT) family protein [Marinomonas spartinae]|uniref:Acetyltransferase (GNAT) family protein n=1 Tax=Marinomonas spartinae TaxID=1792290 RepID=A0A1A8TF12_9GAMM|nr:GNAT family N-acetyltransferase [Marinomonas spartinae]SBS31047.1 Acetyltransferase (GNAT) family protein [Marinomonas spartinae]
MESYQGLESEADYARTSEIIKKPPLATLISSERGDYDSIRNRLTHARVYSYEDKSLPDKIKTPNVAYEQHSTLSVDSWAPNIIIHELDWDDYEQQYIQTVYQDLHAEFVKLQNNKQKEIHTHIPVRYESLIASAIDAGFSPLGAFKRSIGHKIETCLVLVLADDKHSHNQLPLFPEYGVTDGLLTIIPTVSEHCEAFFAEQQDDVAVFWSIFPVRSYTEVKHYCQEARLNNILGVGITASVIENSSQQVVGRVHLRPVVPPKVADVGYGIFPEHRGKGYATKALNLFTQWIFSEAGYVRIELGIKEGNEASERVAKSCGYVRESICPCRLKNQDGSFSTQISYAKVSPFYCDKGEKIA